MKILHSADWHLDSPITGRTDEQARHLRQELLMLPDRVVSLCKAEGCDLLLLAGDLFDGQYTKDSFLAVSKALADANIPVFIAPGNHDYCHNGGVYEAEIWPENVHIFTQPHMVAVQLPQLDCTVYGAGYRAMDCPALLEDFHAEGDARWHIGILHSDPMQSTSPYAPMNVTQVKESALDYLALGHIHKAGNFRAGDTLCAWPGCPMGRGYDEPGIRGVLLVELENEVNARFLPLNTPRFYDETVEVGENALESVSAVLPPVQTNDFYRITLTGYANNLDTAAICSQFPHTPNLELRDRTMEEKDLWSVIHEDSLEGLYFKLLHDGMESGSEKLQYHLKLAAQISRQILDGQEVTLP